MRNQLNSGMVLLGCCLDKQYNKIGATNAWNSGRNVILGRRSFVLGLASIAFIKPRPPSSIDLNTLFMNTSPGDTVDLRGRTWNIDHSITVPRYVNVAAEGATFVQLTDGRELSYPFAKSYSTGLRTRGALRHLGDGFVNGLNVIGPGAEYNPETEAQHAFGAFGPNVVFEEVTATNVLGDGCSFGEQSNCVLREFFINGTGRQGWSWTKGNTALVEDGVFDHIARTAMDLEPMARIGQVVRGATIRRIRTDTVQNYVLGSASSGECHDVLAEDITCRDIAMKFASGGARSNLIFRRISGLEVKVGNAFTFIDSTGLMDGVTVQDCFQEFNAEYKEPNYLIKAHGIESLTLSGNQFPGATELLI